MVVAFDLDDTLFPEMEYVRSAYREIARHYGLSLLAPMMAASTPREAFDATGLPVDEVLDVYRTHRPDIRLPWLSLYVLASLKNKGVAMALVTDGRSVTQRHKIEALGLERFIDKDQIYISEEVGSEKMGGEAFMRIMDRYGEGERYMYVGDNPAKDFVAGNRLGWETVCLLAGAGGENIFSQECAKFSQEYQPEKIITNICELLGIVDFD
ncbi:MAG: HAD family hydrolase [Staphylococcus sp.]|nr:HAD family hydrolase [Staphylococcus sp.]